MKAARCAPALRGGKPNDLAGSTASDRSNFLAAYLNGTKNPQNRLAIRRMSGKSGALQRWSASAGAFDRPLPMTTVICRCQGRWGARRWPQNRRYPADVGLVEDGRRHALTEQLHKA